MPSMLLFTLAERLICVGLTLKAAAWARGARTRIGAATTSRAILVLMCFLFRRASEFDGRRDGVEVRARDGVLARGHAAIDRERHRRHARRGVGHLGARGEVA